MSEEELKKLREEKQTVPLQLGFVAGHCAKCGAPYYQDSFTGALRPICVCWNLPKVKISTGSNT